MNEIKKRAVLTSGGDAAGMNSAVRAVVFSANNLGIEVVGVLRGYEGLIDWETIPLGLDDVRNINNQGGTILFTSRSERFLDQKYRHTAAENLRAHDVDAVVAIGGDGTLRGAIKFKDEGVNIVCIPGTIDRDVACSEYTLGFDTAERHPYPMAVAVSWRSWAESVVISRSGQAWRHPQMLSYYRRNGTETSITL